MLKRCLLALAFLCQGLNLPLQAQEATKTVKVFILAGQSNMEGKARNTLLDYQAANAPTKNLFTHLRKDDKWITRDDVFIKFFGSQGPTHRGLWLP